MKILYAGPDSDLVMTTSGEDRQPGLHLSDILVRMAYERDKKYHPDAPKDFMIFEQGHTWETIVSRALSARHSRVGYRPEQMKEDGVWLSPDWLNPDAEIQHEEWKATKKSSKSLHEKVIEWLPQSMSYLRGLLRRGWVRRIATSFRVWCVMGDWTFESKGDLALLRDYYRVDVEFDKREIEEKWREVLQYGRKYGLLKSPPDEQARGRKTGHTPATQTAGRTPGRRQDDADSSRRGSPSGNKEQQWRRPRLEATIAKRLTARKTKRKAGSPPASEPEKHRLLTFRATRKS